MRQRIGLLAGAGFLALFATILGWRAPTVGPPAAAGSASHEIATFRQARPVADPDLPGVEPRVPLPTTLSQGEVAVWRGRLPVLLRTLAPTDLDPHAFNEGRRLSVPVSPDRRLAVYLTRFDQQGADGGVFQGTLDGAPGSTVVLSYVGDAQAGVIHVPAEGRSYVISGGSDGIVRVTTNDLNLAPGCPPTPPLPPCASDATTVTL